MDARTPATQIPGYSRARLKRIIAAGNVVAFGVVFWTTFFPTQLYPFGLLICVLLRLCAIALDMRTKGALGFDRDLCVGLFLRRTCLRRRQARCILRARFANRSPKETHSCLRRTKRQLGLVSDPSGSRSLARGRGLDPRPTRSLGLLPPRGHRLRPHWPGPSRNIVVRRQPLRGMKLAAI